MEKGMKEKRMKTDERRRFIRERLAEGQTYSQIGAALGITRQGAWVLHHYTPATLRAERRQRFRSLILAGLDDQAIAVVMGVTSAAVRYQRKLITQTT